MYRPCLLDKLVFARYLVYKLSIYRYFAQKTSYAGVFGSKFCGGLLRGINYDGWCFGL